MPSLLYLIVGRFLYLCIGQRCVVSIVSFNIQDLFLYFFVRQENSMYVGMSSTFLNLV